MKETIEMLVTVKIEYPEGKTITQTNKNRKEAVKQAKKCVTSTSMLGSTWVKPIKAKEN